MSHPENDDESVEWEQITYQFYSRSCDLYHYLLFVKKDVELAKRLSELSLDVMRKMGFIMDGKVLEETKMNPELKEENNVS